MSGPRISHFMAAPSRPTQDRTVLRDLTDAPVDTTKSYDVPEEFLAEGRPDAVVAEELADSEVQAVLRAAGLA